MYQHAVAILAETLKSSASILLVLFCAVVLVALQHRDPPDAAV
jgi:hypothetical protein